MPFPWKKKKSTRFSQLISDHLQIQSPKHGGSLVVETGFPTSIGDFVVKNRHLLRPKSRKKNRNTLVNDEITELSLPPVPSNTHFSNEIDGEIAEEGVSEVSNANRDVKNRNEVVGDVSNKEKVVGEFLNGNEVVGDLSNKNKVVGVGSIAREIVENENVGMEDGEEGEECIGDIANVDRVVGKDEVVGELVNVIKAPRVRLWKVFLVMLLCFVARRYAVGVMVAAFSLFFLEWLCKRFRPVSNLGLQNVTVSSGVEQKEVEKSVFESSRLDEPIGSRDKLENPKKSLIVFKGLDEPNGCGHFDMDSSGNTRANLILTPDQEVPRVEKSTSVEESASFVVSDGFDFPEKELSLREALEGFDFPENELSLREALQNEDEQYGVFEGKRRNSLGAKMKLRMKSLMRKKSHSLKKGDVDSDAELCGSVEDDKSEEQDQPKEAEKKSKIKKLVIKKSRSSKRESLGSEVVERCHSMKEDRQEGLEPSTDVEMKSKVKFLMPKSSSVSKREGLRSNFVESGMMEDDVCQPNGKEKGAELAQLKGDDRLPRLSSEIHQRKENSSDMVSSSYKKSQSDLKVNVVDKRSANFGYLVLCLVVLVGLVGGRILALVFALCWCFILKSWVPMVRTSVPISASKFG